MTRQPTREYMTQHPWDFHCANCSHSYGQHFNYNDSSRACGSTTDSGAGAWWFDCKCPRWELALETEKQGDE
jgi:hypothetical protein